MFWRRFLNSSNQIYLGAKATGLGAQNCRSQVLWENVDGSSISLSSGGDLFNEPFSSRTQICDVRLFWWISTTTGGTSCPNGSTFGMKLLNSSTHPGLFPTSQGKNRTARHFQRPYENSKQPSNYRYSHKLIQQPHHPGLPRPISRCPGRCGACSSKRQQGQGFFLSMASTTKNDISGFF